MSFDAQTKARMFIRSGRLCCLCLKQCGTNIEAAHIIDEHKGGSDEEDNGIPVCLDCHQEIGAYDNKHPRGNKFTPDELQARRDHVYRLVENGVIYAQVLANQARLNVLVGTPITVPEISQNTVLSPDAKRFANMLLELGKGVESPGKKLKTFSPTDQAHILDILIQSYEEKDTALQVLALLLKSKSISDVDSQVIVDQIMRHMTLFASMERKVEFLQCFNQDVLSNATEILRVAFFEEIIQKVMEDQYEQVNKIVPVLVNHLHDIPKKLHSNYVFALIDQSRSHSYQGGPAARQALLQLPNDVVIEALKNIDIDYLWYHRCEETFLSFIEKYKNLATGDTIALLDDFLNMDRREFLEKYNLYK